ncbi:MAG: hypothetical protein JSS67_01080 [Bacteroidetes bacterium]|nr:hypothetical protein [Bacteroidota bacterium]
MKFKSNFAILANLNAKEISQLTSEVKETIAYHLNKPVEKHFCVADLWNIQKSKKYTQRTRRFL